MKEYIIGPAKVRIHGEVNQEKLEAATQKFLKKVVEQRKKKVKTNERPA